MVVKMTHKHCLICNAISGLIAVVLFGPAMWWALDRDPAYTMNDGVAHYMPANGKAGQSLDIVWGHVDVLKVGCHGTFNRELEDGTRHILTFAVMPALYTEKPVGVYKNVHSLFPWEIPQGLSGTITLRSKIKTICNPIQWLFPVETVTKDTVFEIPAK
jgi:hypothetical protein